MGTVDIEKAISTIEETLEDSDTLAMTQSEFDTAERLLEDYGQQREELQKQMVSLLGQDEPGNIDREWVDCCASGKEALEELNSSVPPPGGGGLAAVGLGAFHRGESSIWTENSRAEIALRAKEVKTIKLANTKLIQDTNEELKAVLEGEEDVQEYVEGTFGAMLGFLAKTSEYLIAIVKIVRYRGQPSIPDQLSALGDELKRAYSQASDAANRKQALLKILLDRLQLLNEVRSKLDQAAVRVANDAGQKTAASLHVVGKDSPYEAKDWETFGTACRELLEDEAEVTVTNANALFDDLYHTLDEETQKSFEALSTDPDQWQRWEEEIGKSFDSIKAALANVEAYTNTLAAESGVRSGLEAALASSKAMIATYLEDWKKTLEEIKGKLRRS